MTREIALHCMKSYSELHSDLCELCPIYGQTGGDHCFEDALQYVIEMLDQEPTTKNDLAVDCVARQDVERYIEGFINEYTPKEELEFINLELDGLKHIPTVTPQEPCKDCISRNTVLTLINDVKNANGFSEYSQYEYLFDQVDTMPSVTPQEPILDQITEIIEPLRHLPIGEMSDIEWDILRVIDKYKGETEDKE